MLFPCFLGSLMSSLPVLQVAAILTLPFDVVKTQRQVLLGEGDPLLGWYQNRDATLSGTFYPRGIRWSR